MIKGYFVSVIVHLYKTIEDEIIKKIIVLNKIVL